MAWIAPVALQLLTALAAAWGVNRALSMQRYVPDPRLRRLAWFFGLFALALVFHAIWTYQVDVLREALASGRRPPRSVIAEGRERATWALLAYHVTMLCSLLVAVAAFARRPAPDRTVQGGTAAAIGLAFFGDLVPLLLALQAALTLYLAVRAWINHMERRSKGALQVAAGFALFFIGHAAFFVAHRPGEARIVGGDVLALVGIVLLVQVLPGRRARGD